LIDLLLAFDDETRLAAPLAAALGVPLRWIERHRFPDGESKLKLPAELPQRVALLRGLHRPNHKLAELMIVAPAARELGAAQLTLVCPYLAYMRQDMAFSPGEAVSQRHIGVALAAWFEQVITVDPHLHRVQTMGEVLPGRRGRALSAAPLLGAWAARHARRPILLGPDDEAAKVGETYAAAVEATRAGRLDEAEKTLAGIVSASLPPVLRAAYDLLVAGIAMRRLRGKAARVALTRAEHAARQADIPALTAEVESASLVLEMPAARLIARGEERPLRLEEIEVLLASGALVIDACRRALRHEHTVVSLASRPVLFALARALGEAWPGDASRSALLAQAFKAKFADESHRARLRVEVGRLRKELGKLADIGATKRGFSLEPRNAHEVVVLAPPVEGEDATVLAFLADGESWSSSALALALGSSQRTVQRALESLAATGKVQSIGRGRARRWITPLVPGFPTLLLLPAPLPGG